MLLLFRSDDTHSDCPDRWLGCVGAVARGPLAPLPTAALLALGLSLAGCDGAPEAPGPDLVHSTFNGLALDPGEPWEQYSFALMGHLRGGSETPSPNPTLRRHVGRVAAAEPQFVIALGDLYVDASDSRMEEFRSWVEDSVEVPFFNAVGGHDLMYGTEGRAAYEREFGARYFDFTLGSEMFVFLDFQEAAHAMAGEQLGYFADAVQRAASDDAIENVFVLSHKLIWSYHNPEMEVVFRYRHPLRVSETYDHFTRDLKPALVSLAEKKDVYLFAGDIGGTPAHLQVFHHRDEHFTYVATGMGSFPGRNCFVDVSVDHGEVSMRVVMFETGDVSEVELYGTTFWEDFYRANPELAAKAVPEYFFAKRAAPSAEDG